MTKPQHAVLLLAAGESRRLGQPKQLLVVGGEPLVRRAARAALATGPSQALVCVGARAAQVWAAISDLAITRVDCENCAEGMSASICAGLSAIDRHAEGVLIVLCDQPALDAKHLLALVERWRALPGRAAASAYAGTLGVPALLPRAWLGELAGLKGDQGARDLLRARAAEVQAVPAAALAEDLDLPQDIARLLPSRET